jgi:hypothetical protein
MVWNLRTQQISYEHDLDIEDEKSVHLMEDPNKLMAHHIEDASLLFIRGSFRKGISILSLEDGVKIDEIPKMHTKSILQILVKYDKKSKQ